MSIRWFRGDRILELGFNVRMGKLIRVGHVPKCRKFSRSICVAGATPLRVAALLLAGFTSVACGATPAPSRLALTTPEPRASPAATITPAPPGTVGNRSSATQLPSHQAADLPACGRPVEVELSELTLAFVADWDADGEIYTVQADGSELFQVTDNTTREALPRWSPDGQMLAYIDDLFGASRLVVSHPDGSNASVVEPNTRATWEVEWSPNGRQVAFRSGLFQSGDLFVVDVQTGETVNLTRGAAPSPGRPSFSPEGDRMVFAATMPESAGPPEQRLFIVKVDGTGLTELSFPAGDVDYWPMWHPQRDEILFQGLVAVGWIGLYTAALDGSITKLGAEPRYLASLPSWSPDGTMFAYVALNLQQEVEFHVATENEDVDRVVLDSEIVVGEYWGMNRYFWAPDSRHIAFLGSGGAYDPDAIYVMDICGGQPRMVVEEVDPNSEVSWRPLPVR